MDSIFANSNFYNLSDPQATWLFDVMFYSVKDNTMNTQFIDWCNKDIIITSVTLPNYHTEIVTKKYFGSEKSYPVIRTYGGECTMKFDIRAEASDMLNMEKLAQIDALYHAPGKDYILYHPELETSSTSVAFEKVIVKLIDKTRSSKGPTTTYKDKNGKAQATTPQKWGVQAEYEFNNCVITDFRFNEELDYSSESKLTGTITFHYDLWHKTVGVDKATNLARIRHNRGINF